jgi:hypothetical protein
MTRLIKTDTKPTEHFWNIVDAIADEEYLSLFREDSDASRRLYSRVSQALIRIHPGLFLVLGASSGGVEISISANGNPALFPLASEVTDVAPDALRKRFTIYCLRQGRGFGSSLTIGSQRIEPDGILYTSSRGARGLDLHIFLPDFKGLEDEASAVLAGAVYLLLDDALGEEAVTRRLCNVEFRDNSRVPTGASALPRLAEELDSPR